MFSERINNALNTQINKEFYSAYLYLSMAHYFSESGLCGFAHWCKKQAEEEVNHGMMVFNFMTSMNGKIELIQIATPESVFHSPIETVKQILAHEKHITEVLRNIAIMTKEENDFTTQVFLQTMLNEQIEEEEMAYKIYTKLKLYGECKSAMFMIDKELSQRQ